MDNQSRMKNILLIFVLSLKLVGSSQTLEREVIASGGFEYTNANGSGSATAGQVDFLSLTGFNDLTQGFQQPSNTIVIVNETTVEITFPSCLTNSSMAEVVFLNELCENETPTVFINGLESSSPHEIQIAPSVLVFLDYPNDACDLEIELNTEPGTDVEACAFFIPNLITPNGDDQNDSWTVINPLENSYELTVLSRWGEEIFSDSEFTSDKLWNGNDSNGNRIPTGVYFYLLVGQEETYSGTINLLR